MNEQRITTIGIPQQYKGFWILVQSIQRETGDTFQTIMFKDGKFYQNNVFIKYAKKQHSFGEKELKRANAYMMILAQGLCDMIDDPKLLAKAKKQSKTDAILTSMNLEKTAVIKE